MPVCDEEMSIQDRADEEGQKKKDHGGDFVGGGTWEASSTAALISRFII
jgi:hypothetical protein